MGKKGLGEGEPPGRKKKEVKKDVSDGGAEKREKSEPGGVRTEK